ERARSGNAHRRCHRRQRAAGRRYPRGSRTRPRNAGDVPGGGADRTGRGQPSPLTWASGVRTGSTMAAKKIVFQGEPGANSHLASREVYPDYEAVPCATFEDAFTAIASGEAELGMIPIENSVAGRVADIHHLMPESRLHIIAEHFMPVRHQLLAPKGARLEDIKTVESH